MTLESATQTYTEMTSSVRILNSVVNTVADSFNALQISGIGAVEAIDVRMAQQEWVVMESTVSVMERSIQRVQHEQKKLNEDIKNGAEETDLFGEKIKKLIESFDLKKQIKSAKGWLEKSLELSDAQMNAEWKLQTTLQNAQSPVDAYDTLKQKAESIQSNTLFTDQAMMSGTTELALHIQDTDALEQAMVTLSDYAAGMSGGGTVDTAKMTEYAAQLGKAYEGSWTVLEEKGFAVSDIHKKIIEEGTDVEKALVIDTIVSHSWAGLAEQMAGLPGGARIQLANDFEQIREQVGTKLYPQVLKLFEVIRSNMPTIAAAMSEFGNAAGKVAIILAGIVSVAGTVASIIVDNWSWIAPIIVGIVGAMAAYQAILLASSAIQWISNSASIASAITHKANTVSINGEAIALDKAAKAQWGLNTAMLASPITLIIVAVIALIAAIYAVVGVINKVTGSAYSAIGIICGALLTAGAFILNIIIGTINSVMQLLYNLFLSPFIQIIEFIINAVSGGFDGLGGAVKNLIGQIISWCLSLVKVLSRVVDAVFGTEMTDYLTGMQAELTAVGKTELAVELGDLTPTIDHRFGYKDSFGQGYAFGEALFDGNPLDELMPISKPREDPFRDYELNGISESLGEIGADTGAIRDSVEVTSEDLKYLRDLAEQEVINRFTTAEIKVDMVNHNNVNSSLDVNGMVEQLTDGLEEALYVTAAGVH